MSLKLPFKSSDRDAWWREFGDIARLSGPIALTNLAQLAMGTTDVLMMGWVGAETLAAGALGFNLYLVAMIFGIGLMNAAAPMIARDLGRGGDAIDDVRRTVRQGYVSATCVALPSWCGLWWTEPTLRLLGQDAALASQAAIYVHVLMWSMLPFLCYLVLRAFVSALERPMVTLLIGIAGVLFNALGNWCFMLGHCGLKAMGIAGSGLATTLTNILMFTAMAVLVTRDAQFRRYRLLTNLLELDWERFHAFWRLGLPLAATMSFEVTIFNAAVFLMGLIGPTSLAAHAIAIQIAAMSFMVPLGIGQAATVRVGLAFGAGDRDGIRRAGWCAFALATAFMACMSLTMVAAPHRLIGLFLDTTNPDNTPVVQLAVSFLALAALFQIADGAQAVGAGMLRGLHDGRVPMLYALLGYWGIGLPLGTLLAFRWDLGGKGIWIGLATGLIVVATLMMRRWIHREQLGLLSRPS